MHTIELSAGSVDYVDTGGDGPIAVFLHGNPTSSYLWRNVIKEVAPGARCLAPDLVGMGDSGESSSGYSFVDHRRYLDAWRRESGWFSRHRAEQAVRWMRRAVEHGIVEQLYQAFDQALEQTRSGLEQAAIER